MADALLAGRWVLATVLIAAGATKLLPGRRDELVAAIGNYRVLPSVLVAAAARVLPCLEIALGLALGAGVMLVPAASVAAVLLGVFASMVGWHVLRGRRFACGCGSGGNVSWALAGRDSLLAALALAVAIGPSGGLAAWPGWGADPVAVSWRAELPIPLFVVLAIVATRLLVASRPAWSRPAVHAPERGMS